jgi:hypothetical protein
MRRDLNQTLRQSHYSILNLRPSKLPLFQPLVAKHKTRPVPKQHLDPVATLCAKHNNDAGVRVEAQLAFRQRSQSIMALAEIHRLGGDHDPNGLRRVNHVPRARWCAMSAIRLGVVLVLIDGGQTNNQLERFYLTLCRILTKLGGCIIVVQLWMNGF